MVSVKSFKIQENSDIVLYAEPLVEIISGMGCNCQSMGIFSIVLWIHQCLFTNLVQCHQHLKSTVPFLLSSHFLGFSVLENMSVIGNDLECSFLDLRIFFSEN